MINLPDDAFSNINARTNYFPVLKNNEQHFRTFLGVDKTAFQKNIEQEPNSEMFWYQVDRPFKKEKYSSGGDVQFDYFLTKPDSDENFHTSYVFSLPSPSILRSSKDIFFGSQKNVSHSVQYGESSSLQK